MEPKETTTLDQFYSAMEEEEEEKEKKTKQGKRNRIRPKFIKDKRRKQ